MSNFSRRDFLKLAALSLSAAALSKPLSALTRQLSGNVSKPNIIIVVFDALSARHLSLYGYARLTSPNMTRFAERSTVYHSYNSAGNFTIPGTTSLLTGMYPWTTRALNHTGMVRRDLADHNIFNLLGEEYARTGFSQNGWASFILAQFKKDIDTFLPPPTFSLAGQVFGAGLPDTNFAYRSLDDFMFKVDRTPPSLVIGAALATKLYRDVARIPKKEYPSGIPNTGQYPIYFRLGEVLAGLVSLLTSQSSPSFSYLHLFPPHAPYSPNRKFHKIFQGDNYVPPSKPKHKMGSGFEERKVYTGRLFYDEYIADLDNEFGRFIDALDEAGILDTSYLILTSDHGELLERGNKGHDTPLLYDPVVHPPLVIHAPGQTARKDIFTPVSSVDILPTLLSIAGRPIPDWCEGKILPGFGGQEDAGRSTFIVEAKQNSAFAPIRKASLAIRKGAYKLIWYTGYEDQDSFELYNLEQDPEELHDLYALEPAAASLLRDELMERLEQSNQALNHR